MERVYVFLTCDIWKSWSSSQPCWAGTSLAGLCHRILQGVRNDEFEWGMRDHEGMTKCEIADELRKQFLFARREGLIRELLNHLDYGMVLFGDNNTDL